MPIVLFFIPFIEMLGLFGFTFFAGGLINQGIRYFPIA
jgi:hypothetical protein